jgi:hypothetical protein
MIFGFDLLNKVETQIKTFDVNKNEEGLALKSLVFL